LSDDASESDLFVHMDIAMDLEVELEKARNEVLRKIGRNMLLFQQMEYMLKYIVANSELSGNIDELKVNREKRTEKVRTQTMGLLIGQYIGRNSTGE